MNTLKKSLSVLLAVLLMLSLVSASLAVETTEEDGDLDVYVLNHDVGGDGYDGPKRHYFSPYVPNYTYDDLDTYTQINIYTLYNTVTGAVIPAYCSDINVVASSGKRYRQLNLEDSTFAADAAETLRAIVLNGFYLETIEGETDAEHAVRVQQELQRLGQAVGIEDLTIGEAIAGTQCAIWRAAHGTRLEFTDFVRSIYTHKAPSSTKYYEICHEERVNGHIGFTQSDYLEAESDAYLTARIKTVYDYLLALGPVSPTGNLVSPRSFIAAQEALPVQNENGNYDVTVHATVDVEMIEGDDLTVSASLDKTYRASAPLVDGRQDLTLTIEDVPSHIAFNDVTLVIEGNQTVSEVFLYDAKGDRDAGQTMIGMDSSRVPVRAAVKATTDRILNFYKTTLISTGTDTYNRVPLEGIIFDIYYVLDLHDYLYEMAELPDIDALELPEYPDFTLITDANGYASVNLTQHGYPDGIYLVIEREHPAIDKPIDPFYATIPMTNAEGTGLIYDVMIEPKNDVKGNVEIEKDVLSVGNDEASVGPYEPHTWIIGTNVPEDIEIGKFFEISDTLDNRLDYVGNMKLNLETAESQEVLLTLVENTDYQLDLTDVDSLAEDKPSDSFVVQLTREGMVKIAEAIGENDFSDYMIRLYFEAQINANAGITEPIPNQARLEYINSVNFNFKAESDKPVVFFGAANLLKVDADDHETVLSGAVFEVYRNATAEEVAAGADIVYIKGVSAPVVKVSFQDSHDLTSDKVTFATSNENGMVAISGLPYGEYYLLETKAPVGYNLADTAIAFTIDANSHLDENAVVVENVGGTIMPETGGIGTTLFTVLGVVLMGASVLFLIMKKRKDYEV